LTAHATQIGFAIIGCGMIADWHAQALQALPDARLIGAADARAAAAQAFAARYQIKAYESTEALLADDSVTAVCICTPSGLHAPLVIQAAGAGKHIVVEKPMAITREQNEAILAAVEKNHVKLAVISQLRFSPAFVKIRQAMDQKLLGTLVSGDLSMKYYRSQAYYDQSSWRGTWAMDGGGALMNQGIHGIDLLLSLMGPVHSVHGLTRTRVRSIEVEDTAAALIEFESGALGCIQGATSIYPGSPRRLEIAGDKGTITLEEDSITQWAIEGQAVPDDVVVGKPAVSSAANPGAISLDGHRLQLNDMVQAIRNDRRPMIDAVDGKRLVDLILAIYESAKTSRTLYL